MEWLNNLIIKLQATAAVLSVRKVPKIEKITLWHITLEPERYTGIAEGLAQMPLPRYLKIGRKRLDIPQSLEEFSDNLCYAQKLFLSTSETFDIGIILRYIACYYYPIYSRKQWDEKKVLLFYKKVLYCSAKDLYPVSIKLLELMGELSEREKTLLQRTPKKEELSAGVERLNRFSDLTSLLFLQESFRATEAEVMLKPYNDCLVRFMLAKEQNAYSERLQEVYQKSHAKK